MIELSICDVFNMSITILINLLFMFSFSSVFFLLLIVEMFLCRNNLFLVFVFNSKMKGK